MADSFLASLSTRRLDLRSALGSFVVLRHFPEHEHTGDGWCPVCGEDDDPADEHDLSVLNLERYKWGGVRHDSPIDAAFVLERFSESDRPEPSEGDIALFQDILRAIEAVPGGTTAPQRTGDQRQKIAGAVDRNNSGVHSCEFQGKMVISSSWGNQQGTEFLAGGVDDGSLASSLRGFVP